MIISESQDADLYTLYWGTDIEYPSQTKIFNDLHVNFALTQTLTVTKRYSALTDYALNIWWLAELRTMNSK